VLTGDRGVYARPGATVTIADDPADTPPTVSIGDVTAPENSSGAVEVPITLSGPSERPIAVTYATAPGTATVDDFVMKLDSVVFPIRTTTINASVVLNDDTVDEPAQAFTITLSDPVAATLDRSTATFTVTDDDPPPIITATGAVVDESADTATVTVKLSQPTENTVTVAPAISSHSATYGEECSGNISDPDPPDVSTPPADLGTITFLPGSTTATIVLHLCEDFATESDDLVTFTFGSPVNAILATTTVDVRIRDNDM
jgi:hypothetical protein